MIGPAQGNVDVDVLSVPEHHEQIQDLHRQAVLKHMLLQGMSYVDRRATSETVVFPIGAPSVRVVSARVLVLLHEVSVRNSCPHVLRDVLI